MTEQYILAFVLVLARVTAFIGFFPLFGQRQLPMLVKAGMATGLTFFWFGSVADQMVSSEPITIITSVLYIAREAGIGFLLAMTLGFMLVPAKIAGAYIGQEVGLSLASISDPGSMDQSTLVTKILEVLSILLFFGLNVHHFVILCLHHSFSIFDNDVNLLDLPIEGLVYLVNSLPEYGLLILAPIGLCLFLLTIGLSFLNKAAPTLNLFSVGMPLRSGLGILCLLVFMPVIVVSITKYFEVVENEIGAMLTFFAS